MEFVPSAITGSTIASTIAMAMTKAMIFESLLMLFPFPGGLTFPCCSYNALF